MYQLRFLFLWHDDRSVLTFEYFTKSENTSRWNNTEVQISNSEKLNSVKIFLNNCFELLQKSSIISKTVFYYGNVHMGHLLLNLQLYCYCDLKW